MSGVVGPQNQQEQNGDFEATEFGVSLMCLFLTGFFVFCALYLGPYPDLTVRGFTVPVSAVVNWFSYILAVVCFVFFVGFWGVAMQKSPEMGEFFKSIWGGGERGWHYSTQTVALLAAAFLAHLLAALLFYLSGLAGWLFWLEYLAWVVQLLVIVLALFATVMLGFACDAFFIRPILERTAEGGTAFQVLVENVRKRATVIVPILIALITLLVEVVWGSFGG